MNFTTILSKMKGSYEVGTQYTFTTLRPGTHAGPPFWATRKCHSSELDGLDSHYGCHSPYIRESGCSGRTPLDEVLVDETRREDSTAAFILYTSALTS